jgi:hypothetical protein
MINYRGVNNPNYRGGRFFKCLECGIGIWEHELYECKEEELMRKIRCQIS